MTDINLTEEQRNRFRNCTSPEEILQVAKEEGYELSLDQLDDVSGETV